MEWYWAADEMAAAIVLVVGSNARQGTYPPSSGTDILATGAIGGVAEEAREREVRVVGSEPTKAEGTKPWSSKSMLEAVSANVARDIVDEL